MMTLRSRAWCFTINNDTFDDLEKMLDMTFQYLVLDLKQRQDESMPYTRLCIL